MGGNALKTCITRRYRAGEFFALADEMLSALRRDFPRSRSALLPAYRTKPDFGDMDILMENAPVDDLGRWITDIWSSAQTVVNGRTISFECRQLQVDLIGQDADCFDTALAYYSWNDLGNFMGRIAHKLGVRFGHDGLSVIFRDGTHQFGERIVSKDIKRILGFLGYDATRWRAGFDTLDDIYRFAASSPYFNPAIFAYENRNHTARVRDRKRAVYRGFLEWMADRPDLPAYPWPSVQECGGRYLAPPALERLIDFFPDFSVTYRDVMDEFALWRQAKTLFNGEVLSALTGLNGHALGRFMQHLRQSHGNGTDFHRWLVQSGADGIQRWVMAELSALPTGQ